MLLRQSTLVLKKNRRSLVSVPAYKLTDSVHSSHKGEVQEGKLKKLQCNSAQC